VRRRPREGLRYLVSAQRLITQPDLGHLVGEAGDVLFGCTGALQYRPVLIAHSRRASSRRGLWGLHDGAVTVLDPARDTRGGDGVTGASIGRSGASLRCGAFALSLPQP